MPNYICCVSWARLIATLHTGGNIQLTLFELSCSTSFAPQTRHSSTIAISNANPRDLENKIQDKLVTIIVTLIGIAGSNWSTYLTITQWSTHLGAGPPSPLHWLLTGGGGLKNPVILGASRFFPSHQHPSAHPKPSAPNIFHFYTYIAFAIYTLIFLTHI